MTPPKPDFVSTSAVKEALARLTDDELLRLQRVAQLRSSGLLGIEWRDLLNEAVARALGGTRVWPSDVPFMAFMVQTMRSIASEHWRQMKESAVALAGDLLHESDQDLEGIEALNPERHVVAQRTLSDIEALFKGDEAVLKILHGMGLGLSAEEIRETAGLDQRQYETAQKRIRRGIARAFSEECK